MLPAGKRASVSVDVCTLSTTINMYILHKLSYPNQAKPAVTVLHLDVYSFCT